MRKIVLLLLSLNLVAVAQKPQVAVGAIGAEPKKFKALKYLSSQLAEAITNNDEYTGIERSEAILKLIGKEHKTQRSGAIDESQIRELGKRLGVDYLCIVESTQIEEGGEYLLEVKFVHVVTTERNKMVTATSSLKDMKDLKSVAKVLVTKIFGSGASPVQEKTASPSVSGEVLTDTRDGQQYKTVEIDFQIWMAQNMNYEAGVSKCYGNSNAHCKKYGRLYDWKTATQICPKGWHLPSDEEWDLLLNYAGGSKTAGSELKATAGWNNYKGASGNGTDQYGFSALPGGYGISNGSFLNVGNFGYWWSATEGNSNGAYSRGIYYSCSNVYRDDLSESFLLSVRCVRD